MAHPGDPAFFSATTASASALSRQTASASRDTPLATSTDHDMTLLATGILLSASKRRGARAWASLPRPVHRAQG
jgi:hypothetical protein